MRVVGRWSNETSPAPVSLCFWFTLCAKVEPSVVPSFSFSICNFVHWQPPMQWVRGRHVVGWFWKSILGIGFSCYVLVFVLACQKTVVRPSLTRPPSLVMSPILIKLIKYEMTCGDKVVIIQ